MDCPACRGRKIIHEVTCSKPIFLHIPRGKKKCCKFEHCSTCLGTGQFYDGLIRAIYRQLNTFDPRFTRLTGRERQSGGWRDPETG